MQQRDTAWLRHQQARWLRSDAHRWVRPDVGRFVAPGSAITDAFPALSRKYSPDQPRVPAGNPDGGQWTDGSGGSAGPMGQIGLGNLAARDDFAELFQIAPSESALDGVQLAGDPPEGDSPRLPSEEPPEIPPQRPATSAERELAISARPQIGWPATADSPPISIPER